jgi:hypothetical protein
MRLDSFTRGTTVPSHCMATAPDSIAESAFKSPRDSTPLADRIARYLPILAGAVVVALIFVLDCLLSSGAKFPNDDAYIALHNAQVLWAGRDSVYQGTPALFGATSGAQLALLMLFESFIPSAPVALLALCGVMTFVYVLGVYFLSLNSGFSRTSAILTALASLLFAGCLFQFLNGLDTGMAMAAVIWCLALLSSKRYRPALGALCGVMPFVRPELAVLGAGAILVMLCDAKIGGREKAATVVLAAASAAPFLAWYWIDTGGVVPTTIGAKAYFFAEGNLPLSGRLNLLSGGVGMGLVYGFPLIFCLAMVRGQPLKFLCFGFILIVLFAYLQRFPGGWEANSGRYFFVFAPVVVFAVIDSYAAADAPRRRFIRSCIIASIATTGYASYKQFQSYHYYLTVFTPAVVETVGWADKHLPAGATVMVHDAGYIGYAGDFHLVDFTGLKTPACLAVNRRMTFPSDGAMLPEAIRTIANQFHPQYLVTVKVWNDKLHIVGSLRRGGWRVRKIFQSRKAPRDAEVYEIFSLAKD